MARKVKLEKRVPKFDWQECRLPGQGKEIGKAWLLAAFVSALPLFVVYVSNQHEFVFYYGGWIVGCWFVYFFLLPRIARARLVKQGFKARVIGNNYPDLKRLLTAQSRALGLREPECFVISEPVAHVTVLGTRRPGFMVASQMLLGLLTDAEFTAAVQRALMHSRLGHVRTQMLVWFMNQTPPIVRLLVAPLAVYTWVLELAWATQCEISTDRAWVVYNRDPRVCAAVLLKIAAAADPNIEATPADIDRLFAPKHLMDQNIVEMGSAFKLKSAIHDNPFIRDRLEALIDFGLSDESVALAKKMDEAFRAANVTR